LKRLSVIFFTIAFMLIVTGMVCHANDTNLITGCYKKQNGQLRIVESSNECLPSEISISWNAKGDKGDQGPVGINGLNCWDLNANGVCDLESEDKTQDGICDALDCQGPPGPCGPCDGAVKLSEIRIDQSGTDNDEYFELSGFAGNALDGLTYLVIGDYGASNNGVIEAVVDLSGNSMPTSGFFVAAEETFTLGTAHLITNLNFENSDNVTHLLVRDFIGADGDDLDTDDDGVLDVTPWSAIVDCVALVGTVGSGDLIYCSKTVGPDGTFVPGHVYRCGDVWNIGAFDPAGGNDTPSAANSCTP